MSLRHARDDVRLGDRLAEPNRQGSVFVRARPKRFIHEDMPRHIADTVQYREVRDPLIPQTLYEAVARARGRHADTSQADVSH